jgi:hypothetical protein
MIVLGKRLGSGIFPIAALLARPGPDVAANRALGHYTHEKSSVGCAAGLAVLDTIAADDLLGRGQQIARRGLQPICLDPQASPGTAADARSTDESSATSKPPPAIPPAALSGNPSGKVFRTCWSATFASPAVATVRFSTRSCNGHAGGSRSYRDTGGHSVALLKERPLNPIKVTIDRLL